MLAPALRNPLQPMTTTGGESTGGVFGSVMGTEEQGGVAGGDPPSSAAPSNYVPLLVGGFFGATGL